MLYIQQEQTQLKY